MAAVSYPTTLYVQLSDCGGQIRKWSREYFEGGCGYRLAEDTRCWSYPNRGSITASCGCKLGPDESGELISYWDWDNGELVEFSGSYCVWHALPIKISGRHISTWVYEIDQSEITRLTAKES